MEQAQLGRRARKTREEVFAAAMDLFARHGVNKVSMQEIADLAETARSTVFKHYPQKHALLADFFMRFADVSLANAKSREPTDCRSGMQALFLAIEEEARKVEPVLREVAGMTAHNGPLAAEEAEIDNQMMVYIMDQLILGTETGEVSSDIDIREAAKLILCVIIETNHEAIHRGRLQHLADDQMLRFNLLFRGLGVLDHRK